MAMPIKVIIVSDNFLFMAPGTIGAATIASTAALCVFRLTPDGKVSFSSYEIALIAPAKSAEKKETQLETQKTKIKI